MKYRLLLSIVLILLAITANACTSGKSDNSEPTQTDGTLSDNINIQNTNVENTTANIAITDQNPSGMDGSQNAAPNGNIPPAKENTDSQAPVQEVKPDDLKENITGTKWNPTPEQVAAVQKDYQDYHFEMLSCDNPYCEEDDEDDYEEDDDNIDTQDIPTKAQAKDPVEQERERQRKRAEEVKEKWYDAYKLASAKFCSELNLPPNVDCKVYENLYIECGMDINDFFGDDTYQIQVHENTKAFQVEFDWKHPRYSARWDFDRSNSAENLKEKLQQVECIVTGKKKYWKCINPDGCGQEDHKCHGFEYTDKVNNDYQCLCPHSKYKNEAHPDTSFICQLAQDDKPRWFCNQTEGCDYLGEKIPYRKSLSCLESGSEFIYNKCYCNGKQRSFADETPCEPPIDSDGYALKYEYGHPEKIYTDEVPYLKEIAPGQFCDRTNGCTCEGISCPQSGICTLKGCVDVVTGTMFAHSDGYWVSGIYKQCDEINGCQCGENPCNYGDVCFNNWFCSDQIKTEIHNGNRYIYDDGERYRKKFEGWVGEYESQPCNAKIMNELPAQYACMYAFDISDCTDGCLGGLDEIDYEGIPIARCASSEGCPCGDSTCPEYARCILDACYYDKMYEVMMCGGEVSDIVTIYNRIALDPAENVDVSGNCLVGGYIRPPKFSDVVTNYPKQPIDFIFDLMINHPEVLSEDKDSVTEISPNEKTE